MRDHPKDWCPACDHGWVEYVRIAPGAYSGWLCAECEAFWEEKPLETKHLIQFSAWLAKVRIDPAQLTVLRE